MTESPKGGLFRSPHFPLYATLATFVLLLVAASLRYTGFFSPGVFLNLLGDNAFLGIAAVGMTFVILSGGIDLSVGSIIGLTSILSAVAVERAHLSPGLVIPALLAFGALFGAGMGALIHFFALAPFLVTLSGMFLARGLALVVSQESIALDHPFYQAVSAYRFPSGSAISFPITALAFIAVLAVGAIVATYTRFGRNVYAIGGNEHSSRLMGLPVGRTKIALYALSGFCAALAGVTYTFYTSSGNATAGAGLELDAIAATVIGGTLLSGGSGTVFGTLIGVLILGTIQTCITFEDGVSSWWAKIAIGGLLFAFIVLQRATALGRRRT